MAASSANRAAWIRRQRAARGEINNVTPLNIRQDNWYDLTLWSWLTIETARDNISRITSGRSGVWPDSGTEGQQEEQHGTSLQLWLMSTECLIRLWYATVPQSHSGYSRIEGGGETLRHVCLQQWQTLLRVDSRTPTVEQQRLVYGTIACWCAFAVGRENDRARSDARNRNQSSRTVHWEDRYLVIPSYLEGEMWDALLLECVVDLSYLFFSSLFQAIWLYS